MKLKMWQVDAFAAKPFEGNPAGVVALERWLDDGVMQAIAAENNLAETAFFVPTAPGAYDLRWFTPTVEVDLCGHATLASAFILFRVLDTSLEKVRFTTRSGELIVQRGADGDTMALPAAPSAPFAAPDGFAAALAAALNSPAPAELHVSEKGGAGARALIAVWNTADAIAAVKPQAGLKDTLLQVKAGSLLATAPGDEPYDFVSRFFAPGLGVPEDPVTGSAHCALTPFWAKRLSKKTMRARQLSTRGGDLRVTDAGDEVFLQGPCALYFEGEINI
ncbi:MAG: PhzF family phenazine biosynthesis protein [Alphaproteobacteria bacterium]|nr:PhzF family phenazine biosynthesis protein [Alphaproteobacteria bacterium]